MVLYARHDLVSVVVPVENGGCGVTHTRPVINGEPSKEFKLVCTPCENFLRADIARSGGNKKVRTINGDTGLALKERYLGLWGASPETTPESPDEELQREHNEQASITANAASQTQTLQQIGDAVKGNADLMAKFLDLQIALAKRDQQPEAAPPPPVPANAESRDCLDCGKPIVRADGQKGALPWRCPECKAKKRGKAA